MSKVPNQAVQKLMRQNFWGMHFAAALGFYTGVKLCDYLFFDDSHFEELREQMEDEYWAKHGEPTEIKPYIVKSKVPGRENQDRKSWIYIMYEKDNLIKKKEDID